MNENTSYVFTVTPTANLTTDRRSYVEAGLIVAVVGIFVIITITGNLLTLVAFYRDEKLRSNMSNWYLVNLACADLLVGCVPLPLDAALFLYQGSVWTLGEIVCKSLLTVEFIATTGSICAIVLISLDRYWLVTRELSYKMFQTKRKVLVLCLPTWAVVCLVTVLLVWGYPHLILEQSIFYHMTCDAEFLYHQEPAIVYSIVTCFIPLALLVYFNVCVYVNVYRRSRRRGSPRPTLNSQQGSENRGRGVVENEKLQVPVTLLKMSSPHNAQTGTVVQMQNVNGPASTETVTRNHDVARARDRRHVKTARTLAIIVGAYLICWAPYNITLMVATFSQNVYTASDTIWVACLYLLRFNSTLNPFLYALCNVRFRRNFKKMLCCCRKRK